VEEVPATAVNPGTFGRRGEVPKPFGYAVFDCETTGTDPEVDEIVSLAILRLDASGHEFARYRRLIRPAQPIPEAASAVHGLRSEDVASAPAFAEVAAEVALLLAGAVFVAHNAAFDLAMIRGALAANGTVYEPPGVACTLDAFRLLEPFADNHRLESVCGRHGIVLGDAHEALSDVEATAALLRVLIHRYGVAPETVELDHAAFMRQRSLGDERPATEPQIRRVFALARAARFVQPDGEVDRDGVIELVASVAGHGDVDALTREQVQAVYDELELRIADAA
jgi:DNA polymerase III epsilon subunit-like protein